MDDGLEKVADTGLQAHLRRQATQVYFKSILLGVGLTLLCLLPG